MFGYVYLTTNLINNKKYIGRRTSNKFLGNEYLGSGSHLKNAIKKYGKENFSVELLESCDSLFDLIELEKYYIRLSNAVEDEEFYNVSYGGPNEGWIQGNENIALRPEILEINRNKHLGKKLSEEQKRKISDSLTGKKHTHHKKNVHSEFTKKYLSECTKNYNLTKRDYTKISKSAKGNKMMNKDGICKRIHPEHFDEYLADGWVFGGLSRKGKYKNRHQKPTKNWTTKDRIAINNGIINKFVKKSDLNDYLNSGFVTGLKKRDNS